MFVTRSKLVRDLTALGLAPGDVVMAHSSMRAVGPVLGGGDVVVAALLDAAGPGGTVMAYTDWEDGVQHLSRDDATVPFDPARYEELPPFDPRTSRARREYGVLPELVRTTPGAVRSGNPGASVAAVGARAAWLCADHPLQYGYGAGSPLAKLVEARGKVLMLGAPLDAVTLLHHAEDRARLRGKRVIRYREPMLVDGKRRWVDFEEFDTGDPVVAGAPDDYFAAIAGAYLETGGGRKGVVGRAESHLFDAAGLVAFAVAWMESRWGG